MGCSCCGTVFVAIICVVAAFCYRTYKKLSRNLPKPNFDLKQFWGKGAAANYKEDVAIKPFKISFGDDVIAKLKGRLDDAGPFTDSLEDSAFHYGFRPTRLMEILAFWKDSYLKRWNERQEFLNQYPQFQTQIQGLNIHYLHIKPKVKEGTKVFPILLLHGWPGSIREFYEIIPLLTTPSKDNIAFEVIAASLPGFGFSEGAAKKGLSPDKMAVVLRNLMLRIGVPKFYIQAGDWGSVVGSHMSALFPENVLGYHTNFINLRTALSTIKTVLGAYFPSYFIEDPKYISWMYPLKGHLMTMVRESGYFHQHATKPDTLGIALSNNPVGLAAWILEKFSVATDRNYNSLDDGGCFGTDFTFDALIDNLMIYYLSRSETTSIRIYKEAFNLTYPMDRVAVEVPTGVAHFRNEIGHYFNFVTQERFKKIIHNSYFDFGGHFAALQNPQVLYEDVVEFVKKTI